MRCVLPLLACVSIAACAPDSPPIDMPSDSSPVDAVPADARLANLYRQSCRTCHALPNTGAPRTRDRAQWDPRWAKGMPALLQSTVAGMNGMPPGGQCFSCSAADYEALIRFLAGRN